MVMQERDDRRTASAPVRVGPMRRRHLRSKNTWLHNVKVLVKGKDRCTLLVHPSDATRLGLTDGGLAQISSEAGSIVAPVEVSDEMLTGVVSLPHGWGHDADGAQLRVARERPGAKSNVLTDELDLEPLTGTAVLNGIPVQVAPVRAETEVAGAA